jgi:hypothetical protein
VRGEGEVREESGGMRRREFERQGESRAGGQQERRQGKRKAAQEFKMG